MKRIYILTLLLFAGLVLAAQKPEKVLTSSVFTAMDSKVQSEVDSELDKATADLNKALIKEDNPLSHFVLSVAYGWDTYTKRDYFESWKHFKIAFDRQSEFTPSDIEALNEYFFKQDKKRRNRPLNKNMDWERDLVEEKLIKFVREENNLEYANRFLSEFPDSKYAINVQHIRTYIEYRIAENSNNVESYDAFLAKYPNAAQKDIATLKRNALAYKNALAQNTLAALKTFVTKYPNAEQVDDARKLMSTLAYDEAVKKRTLEAIEQFMKEYPNSAKMPEAKQLKKQLLFEWAKNVNTIDAYNKFVALYPEGNYYIDIFNLKAAVLGQQILMDFPMENYQFVRGYDNQQFNDFGGSIIQRAKGDYVLVINSKRSKDDMYDNWLLGLDAEGKMVWNSFLGNKYDDFATLVATNSANEVFVAGITNAIKDSIEGQTWLYKLAADGSNIYNTKLEGTGVLAMGLFDNGNVILGSLIQNQADSTDEPLLIKVNSNGKKLWSRTYSSSGKLYGLDVKGDATFLTTGSWICALDVNGYITWDKFFTEGELLSAVKVTSTGNVIFAGKKGNEAFAVAFNEQGNKIWEQTYSAPGAGSFSTITELSDGTIALAGTFEKGIGIFKINAQGNLVTKKEFNLPNGIELNGMIKSDNNSIIISATRLGATSDIFVFKLSL